MTTPFDWAVYVAFRTFYSVRPPKPLGSPATLTVYTGDGTERLTVKQAS